MYITYVIYILYVYYTDFIAGNTVPSTHWPSNTAQKRGFYLFQSRMFKWEKCFLTFERILTQKPLIHLILCHKCCACSHSNESKCEGIIIETHILQVYDQDYFGSTRCGWLACRSRSSAFTSSATLPRSFPHSVKSSI